MARTWWSENGRINHGAAAFVLLGDKAYNSQGKACCDDSRRQKLVVNVATNRCYSSTRYSPLHSNKP
eukprot:m.327179 g.327179  ORF g.327179 m.327179 type:complete len:67 (-) comp16490_c1_seq2:30-230(-)